MQSIIIIGVSTTTNKRIVSHRDARSDKFDYAYDYNYYITEDDAMMTQTLTETN